MVNIGPLAAEIGPVGAPQLISTGVLRLGSITAGYSSSGCQPKFVAFHRGCHLYSAERPSRWASAHILVCKIKADNQTVTSFQSWTGITVYQLFLYWYITTKCSKLVCFLMADMEEENWGEPASTGSPGKRQLKHSQITLHYHRI